MSNLSEKARVSKNKYNVERTLRLRKEKVLKQFNLALPYDLAIEINAFLKENNMSKADLIKYGYEKIKKEI